MTNKLRIPVSKAKLKEAMAQCRRHNPDAQFSIETVNQRFPSFGVEVRLNFGHSWFSPTLYTPRLKDGDIHRKADVARVRYSLVLEQVLQEEKNGD